MGCARWRRGLKKIVGIQLELSFVECYSGERLFKEMVDYLWSRGFTLVFLQPLVGNLDRGALLQADGTFYRLDDTL